MELTINGQRHDVAVRDACLLVELLRDELGLTGTAVGCDTAQCGACTVLMNGHAVKACNVLARQAEGAQIQTVEGLAPRPAPQPCAKPEASGMTASTALAPQWHALQLAFSRHHALQCGFCTPGMLMRALAMLGEQVPAEPAAVRRALAGNLCRCTGYQGIVQAICEWLAEQRGAAQGARADHARP
jgi:carbon-monoxide dehydrogenase small subunit